MPTTQLANLDELGVELFRLTRLVERAHARVTGQERDGVERAAFLLLAQLVRGGPQRLSTLADAVHSDVSTVSRQVAQLIRRGLVERRPDPTDGRAGLFAATEAGVAGLQARRRRRNEAFAEMLRDWSPHDVRRLGELLARFNHDFERHFLGER
jgi:DNA-binding MarR family transcriptional regulator